MANDQCSDKDSLVKSTLWEIIRNSGDYLFVKDTKLVYHVCSKLVAQLAGFEDPSSLVGKNDFDIFSKELAKKFQINDRKVLDSGKALRGELERIPDQDGAPRWARIWKYPLHDSEGRIIGLYGICRDVSREIEMEEHARQAKEYFDIIRNIPVGIGVLHDEDGVMHLDFANQGFYDAHHANPEEWKCYLGSKILDVVYQPDQEKVLAAYDTVRSHPEETCSVVFRTTGSDSHLHWVNVRFRFAYSRSGIKYFYAAYSNLDNQKRMEHKLEESLDTLRDTMENSDIQFFTYYPGQSRCELYAKSRRLPGLPEAWNNFPDAFFEDVQVSPEDQEKYRGMLDAINKGANEASCLVKFNYRGASLWEKVHLKALRDLEGHVVRVQGDSINVNDRIYGEERLRKQRIRLETMDKDVFETFSFNLSKASKPFVQTSDKAMLDMDIREKDIEEATRIQPSLATANPEAREILLRAASRIPDAKDRERFIGACSGDIVRRTAGDGYYKAHIEYRRYVGKEVHWVSTSIEVLPEPESGELYAFYYTKDIHDHVLTELVSKAIAEKNYTGVSCLNLRSGVFRVLSGSDTALQKTNGMSYGDALHLAVQEYVSSEDSQAYMKALSLPRILDVLDKKPSYTVYNTRKRPAGAAPDSLPPRMKNDIFYLDEHRDIIIYLLSDVTEVFEQERESREKLEAALAASKQASLAKTEFLSRMSHEIRTPMNAIIGLNSIAMQEPGLSPTMVDHLEKTGASARFLLSLINDILDMSRIESGRISIRNETFNFEEMIKDINTIFYEQCRENGLEYECIFKSFIEESYKGDVTKLQQILVNLLGNAVKFTPRGGKIHFMIEQLARRGEAVPLRFEVCDTGIGIDKKFMPDLFKAFAQESSGTTSPFGGTGLGLAIAKKFARLMHGDITVQSRKNDGSTFTVYVELGLADKPLSSAAYTQKILPISTLVVDDDDIVCRHARLILNQAGLQSEYADSGTAAIKKVSESHAACRDYDLILVDWKMPDMDGFETARAIRQIVGSQVVIFIMTTVDLADGTVKDSSTDIDFIVRKPFFASALIRAYEAVVTGRGTKGKPDIQKGFDFSGKRILLAEDNEINAEIAQHLLKAKGCAVEHAPNGAKAVEAFAAAPAGYFDAILMDVRMPIMDGIEATRTIRAMSRDDARNVPILAMTANAFQEDVQASLNAGMDAHLTKPIMPEKLYAELSRRICGFHGQKQ